jgi:hypothetical protein
MTRTTTRVFAGALLLATSLALTACGTPPWEQAGTSGSDSSSTPKPTSSGQITTVVNELAAGSTKHELTAGDIGLAVDYFSTLNMAEWTADADKPLSISMSGTLGTDDGQSVYLSRLGVSVAVYGPDGILPGPDALNDSATVAPGYLVKAPYSYSQTFILPPVDSAATYVKLSLTYELLLQTTPTSAAYAKQTASDTLTIAIAQP